MLRKIGECVLCHSKENEWRKVFALNEDQDLIQCKKCGLFFNNYQRIDYKTIYCDDYFGKDESVGSGGGFFNYSALEKGIQKMYKFAYDFIISHSNPKVNYKLMDIGCSYGFFLKMFQKEKNFSPLGVELNKMSAEEAQKQGLNVLVIPFEEFAETEMFDYITFFELIEHTISPLEVMRKINCLLKPGGYAIFSTPDIGSIYFKILGKKWSSIHPAVHNYYFDEATVRLLAKASDFEIISIRKSHIMWSDAFHFRKRLSEMFPHLKNILKPLSFIDSLVLPFFNGGDLRVILRKKV
jgi:SAM-dependent methyltransferase